MFRHFNVSLPLKQISNIVDVVRDPRPIGQVPQPKPIPQQQNVNLLPLDMALREPDLPETEVYTVQLRKDDLGLGITVAGYVCEKEDISGIFVKSISKGSAADIGGRIKVNDRIIEVNEKSVVGFNNHQAVELLRNTGSLVTLKLERYLRGPKFEQLQLAIKANELKPPSPPSPSLSSLPKIPLSMVVSSNVNTQTIEKSTIFDSQQQMSYLTIEPEQESGTSVDFDSAILLESTGVGFGDEEGNEIVILDSNSARLSSDNQDLIRNKWSNCFGDEVEIVVSCKNPTV